MELKRLLCRFLRATSKPGRSAPESGLGRALIRLFGKGSGRTRGVQGAALVLPFLPHSLLQVYSRLSVSFQFTPCLAEMTQEPRKVDSWSDEEWESFLDTESERILTSLSDNNSTIVTEFSSITSSSDSLLPLAIDHTLLKPEATLQQIDKLCEEALQYGFKSCCVNSIYAKRVSEQLRGSKTIVCCVINFPLGAASASSKAAEAQAAILDGAEEIDMVLPVGLLLSSSPPYSEIYHHVKAVVSACRTVPVKVIIETGLLKSDRAKVIACLLAAEAGAAFVKTCTGFSGGQATEGDVRLMWNAVRRYNADGAVNVRVKASGGVRTLESCLRMFRAGAERIGTSSGVALVTEQRSPLLSDEKGSY